MYLLDIPPVAYLDPWESTFHEQIRQLSRSGYRVAYYYEQTNNSTFRYRTYNMIQTLNMSELPVTAAYFTQDDLNQLDDILALADVLVICRSRYSHLLDMMVAQAKRRGIPVYYDIDDFVFDTSHVPLLVDTLDVDPGEAQWNTWFAEVARNGAVLRLCDGTITTNDFLAQRLRDFTGKPVHVLPNFLNEEQLEISERIYKHKQELRFARDGAVHLGYFSGSLSHNKDFRLILDTLLQLLHDYPQTMLRVAGYMDIKDVFQPYRSRIEVLPFTDFINLQRNIGSTEINLVPLQDNMFTNSKSQLKYFEAGIVGTVTVASPIFTYRSSIEHGKNGYLAASYQWYDILSTLIENIDSVHPVIEAAHAHSLEQFAWYNQIDKLARVFLQSS